MRRKSYRLIYNLVVRSDQSRGECVNGFCTFCAFYRVILVQLVRFLVVELTHLDSNFRFDMCVVFTTNYFFSGR
jgi:hypothetical protein